MSLPANIQSQARELLQLFCDARVPERVRDQVKLNFSFDGNSVTLSEERPKWNDPTKWISSKVAQFRYQPGTGTWVLFCRDQNGRWHEYFLPADADLGVLLKEVDRDPTGIFWG